MNNRIKELREEKGLTLEKLGEKVDIAKNTLSRYESGNREPKLKVWQKLADYFNVSVPYLQGFEMRTPNRLRELRESQELTLKDTVKKMKDQESLIVTADALAKYERGDREPKLEVWQKLARFFNVSVPYLQGFNEHKPNRLKELRNKKGMSQSQFVQAFNELLISKKMKPITIPTYSRWENSLNSPTEKVWQQLADYFEVSVPYLKGEIDTEYLGKIIKTIYLVACNKKVVIKTKKESIITEIDRTIAITELLLLMFKQLNLDHRSESREIFEKNASLLGLVGDEKVDYIKEVSVSATEENYKYGIECAKALIDFYDSL